MFFLFCCPGAFRILLFIVAFCVDAENHHHTREKRKRCQAGVVVVE